VIGERRDLFIVGRALFVVFLNVLVDDSWLGLKMNLIWNGIGLNQR
jgi:hypothetical protein